jgi:hypothetical protein
LLFVGEQYSQAIESYWRKSPGGIRKLPAQIDDLIEDRRFPQPVRHLRKRFVDPLAPSQEWGLVRQGSALIGVYSQARGEPFRTTGFAADRSAFEGARSYSDWQFVASVNKAKLPAASTARPALRIVKTTHASNNSQPRNHSFALCTLTSSSKAQVKSSNQKAARCDLSSDSCRCQVADNGSTTSRGPSSVSTARPQVPHTAIPRRRRAHSTH